MLAPLAVKLMLCPLHKAVVPLMLTVGKGLTETVEVRIVGEVQPKELVPAIV